jgi:hypothetical protein
MARRTQAQLDFDMAKHGWAFCNKAMLKAKMLQLNEIAKRLSPKDERHETLAKIVSTLEQMNGVGT